MKQQREPPLDWQTLDSSPLQYLTDVKSLSHFRAEIWEQGPRHFPSTSAKQKVFAELASKQVIQDALAGLEHVQHGTDVNAARYKGGARQTLGPQDTDGKDGGIWRLYSKEDCTLQVMQPQRWIEGLWRLAAALESQLGCLVGINAYLTPPGTQGLAPHHDDVELWICQTQGSKRWRLYEPHMQLPNMPSPDFDPSKIGKPTMEVTMQEGDVLYMPRGTIHQAVAQEADSVHLTISTYQRWNHGELASRLMSHAAASSSEETAQPRALRAGLPYAFPQAVQADSASAALAAAADQIAEGLEALARQLRESPGQLLGPCADLTSDFMSHRLPPHPQQLRSPGDPPGLKDRVTARWPGLACIVDCPVPEGEDVPEDLAGQKLIKVMSCLHNERKSHMIMGGPDPHTSSCCTAEGHCHHTHPEAEHAAENGNGNGAAAHGSDIASQAESSGSDDEGDEGEDASSGDESEGGDCVFAADYRQALAQLLAAPEPVQVKQLALPTDEEKVGLSMQLWSDGLLCNLGSAGKSVRTKQVAGNGDAKRRKK